MSYKLNDLFYTIQGEGFWTGTPMTFIRFSGCNLSCEWCDTDFKFVYEKSINDIIKFIKSTGNDRVCLTGGEPLLQHDMSLANFLLMNKIITHIETNGTIGISDLPYDWLTVSPKEGEDWTQREGNELKVVYTGQELEQYFDSEFEHYFLQPEWSRENYEEVVKIIKEDPRWRMSIQTHKLLNIK